MMLLFRQGQKMLAEIQLDYEKIDNIVFGNDKVKELSFTHTIKNSDEQALMLLKEKIDSIDFRKATEIIVYFNEDVYYSYKTKIKDVYYRVCSYMRERQIELTENLSIRFVEDNEVVVDGDMNIALCDEDRCAYFKKGYCEKYKEVLLPKGDRSLIAKGCYLEMWPALGTQFFKSMIRQYKESLHEEAIVW